MENNAKDLNDKVETPEMSEEELWDVSGGLKTAGGRKSSRSQDKLGNFEIQDLMSSYNQAQTLASSVLKKMNDTTTGIIGKI